MLRTRTVVTAALLVALLVAAVPAGHGAAQAQTEARGLVVAGEQTVLSAEVAGKVTELAVQEGERFRKGDVLAKVDCRIHRLTRDRLTAEARSAEKTLLVQRQLAELNSGSALDAAVAESELARARAEIAIASETIEKCSVAAPYDGRVVAVEISRHQHVAVGQPMVEILDDRELEVEIIVPSHWLAWLKTDAAFVLTVDETGARYAGHIVRAGTRIDPASQSLKIVGRLDAPAPAGTLLPGMSGTASFQQ